jgi:alkanesulfonate monooxygenase SsuD/methylene tetrahydromethanopterin reductase-like flavin-dependent oxidoreductase (luciferase family)
VKLGVALGWHVHPWEQLEELTRRAEELGYAAVYVDGDASMLERRRDADVLDGWTVTTALLARTRRIEVGSLRLVHHWNTARLAQSVATAQRIAPGRLRLLIGIGDRPGDERFGLPVLDVAQRIAWLDESLTAMRALWSGEEVSFRGRHVELRSARVRPTPPGGKMPIAVAARRPRMLELVAKHADRWEINLPPLRDAVECAAAQLDAACRARGRNPEEISRSQWIFTRVESRRDASASCAEYRRLNPWFREYSDAQIAEAVAVGSAADCRRKLAEFAASLRLELPVIDLSGLPAAPARRLLEALGPAE